VGGADLTVVVLEQVGQGAVEHAGPAAGDTGRVLARAGAGAARLDADQGDVVVEEGAEEPDGVAAAADAGGEPSGSRPSAARIWARASFPMTPWSERTMDG
jgi:hypothetical protein